MAHRSKLSQIVIDGTDLHTALAFWAGALGLPTAAARIEEPYATLGDIGGLHAESWCSASLSRRRPRVVCTWTSRLMTSRRRCVA